MSAVVAPSTTWVFSAPTISTSTSSHPNEACDLVKDVDFQHKRSFKQVPQLGPLTRLHTLNPSMEILALALSP